MRVKAALAKVHDFLGRADTQAAREELLGFRDYVWKRFGIAPRPSPHPAHVTLIVKALNASRHPQYVANVDSLARAFRGLGVTASTVSWAGMPLREQARGRLGAD